MSKHNRFFLTDGEVKNLKNDSQTNPKVRILIGLYEGQSISSISKDLKVSRPIVYKYKDRLLKALSPDFSAEELERLSIDLRNLCRNIRSEGYALGSIKAPEDSIEWLNETLKVPNFYDQCVEKNKELSLTQDIKCLALETKESRSKRFEDLPSYEAFNIQRLNRKILNHLYDLATKDWITRIFQYMPGNDTTTT